MYPKVQVKMPCAPATVPVEPAGAPMGAADDQVPPATYGRAGQDPTGCPNGFVETGGGGVPPAQLPKTQSWPGGGGL